MNEQQFFLMILYLYKNKENYVFHDVQYFIITDEKEIPKCRKKIFDDFLSNPKYKDYSLWPQDMLYKLFTKKEIDDMFIQDHIKKGNYQKVLEKTRRKFTY